MKSFFKNLIKEDPLESALNRLLLFTQSTSTLNIPLLFKYYEKVRSQQKQQELIQMLIVQIQKRKSMIIKLKILMFLFSIAKISTFDISQLITRKKLKLFIQENKKSVGLNLFDLSQSTKEPYIHKYIILGIYNYMIKLSANQQLHRTCISGKIPEDDVFRKGSRIRYIWVFKIFNLINMLIPLLSPALILLEKFPKQNIFNETLSVIKKDVSIYINFISNCIEQTSRTNPFLLPYNDCLQYYQCVKEYRMFKIKNSTLINEVGVHVPEPAINFLTIEEETYAELEILAMRIQLINNSLKSSSTKQNDNERMVTEYNDKVEKYKTRLQTLQN